MPWKLPSIASFTTCSMVHGYKSSWTTSCLVCGTSMQVQLMRTVLRKRSKPTFGGRCGSYRTLRKGLVPSKKAAPSWPERSMRLLPVACDFSGRFGYLADVRLCFQVISIFLLSSGSRPRFGGHATATVLQRQVAKFPVGPAPTVALPPLPPKAHNFSNFPRPSGRSEIHSTPKRDPDRGMGTA